MSAPELGGAHALSTGTSCLLDCDGVPAAATQRQHRGVLDLQLPFASFLSDGTCGEWLPERLNESQRPK